MNLISSTSLRRAAGIAALVLSATTSAAQLNILVEFENLNMRVEKVLAPGASSFVVLPKLKPGEYEFIDEFHMDTGRMWVIAK